MVRSLRFLTGAALATLVVVGCQTTPRLAGRNVEVLSPGATLAERNPTDVVVAPIRLTDAALGAPASSIRSAARRGLVLRLYSPLAQELVSDARGGDVPYINASASGGGVVREAGYTPGRLDEDAIFEVTVFRWDDQNWQSRRSLTVGIEARMIDPANPYGPALWAGRLEQGFDVSGEIGPAGGERRALTTVCDQVFRELLARMPARRPEAVLGGGDWRDGEIPAAAADDAENSLFRGMDPVDETGDGGR